MQSLLHGLLRPRPTTLTKHHITAIYDNCCRRLRREAMASPAPPLLACAERVARACGEALTAASAASATGNGSRQQQQHQQSFEAKLRIAGSASLQLVELRYATATADDALLRNVLDTKMVERIR